MGEVEKYKVYYLSLESQKWMVEEVSKDLSSAEIHGLEPFTSYIVYVAAYSGHDLPSYMHDVKTNEGGKLSSSMSTVDQFICSSLADPLINSSRDSKVR